MRDNVTRSYARLREASPGLLAIVVLMCLLFLYLPFLSRHVVGDDIVDLIKVERGPADDYFAPNHLLHVSVGYIFYSLWKLLGYTGGAFLPMAVISALSGATGIALLFLLLYKIARDRVSSFVLCLLAGLSYSYWYHSTTMRLNYNIIAVVPTTLCLLTLIYIWEKHHLGSKCRYAIFMALSLSLAVVFYQASILLLPALLFGLFLDKQLTGLLERLKLVFLFSLIFGISIGVPYLFVGVFIKGLRNPTDFITWWSTYETSLPMWGRWEFSRIPRLVQTLIAYIVPLNEGLRLRDLAHGIIHLDRLVPQLSLAATLLSLIGGMVYLVCYRRQLWSRYAALIIVNVLFLLCSLIFFAWFDPYEIHYWLVHFIPVWVLLALIVVDLKGRFPRFSSALFAWGVGLLVTVAFSTSSLSIFPRRFEPDVVAEKARRAEAFMSPSDIIISPTWDWTGLVPYFAERKTISLLGVSARLKADRVAELSWLDRTMAEVWADGGHVYLVDVYSYTPEQWQFITYNTGFTLEDFSKYERRVAWLDEGEIVWEIVPQ